MSTINIPVTITAQEINDILCTALNGGINYWCNGYNCNLTMEDVVVDHKYEYVGHGGYITLDTKDNDEGHNDLIVTKHAMLHGIQQWVNKNSNQVETVLVSNNPTYTTIEIGNIDAGDADHIVQYAMFDKIIYG